MRRTEVALICVLAALPAAAQEDLLPPERPRSQQEIERAHELEAQLAERRTLLRAHQITGLTLLAAMGTTVVLGQLEYSDKYGGGGDTGRWHLPHQVASYATAGIFAAAGVLALLAPSPFERQKRVDTATLHKIAVATATAGMVAQVALGIAAARSEGSLSQRDLALAHQWIGYATAAATATGFVVLTF